MEYRITLDRKQLEKVSLVLALIRISSSSKSMLFRL